MSDDRFEKPAAVVKLDTLSDVNDIGKPWRYEEDGLTVTRVSPWSPPGCHPVGCGLKLYVDENGKLVRVEGDENDPVTQGRLCPRCLTLVDYVYNPARITYPMKRDPKDRGNADAWERCSWEEAYSIIKSEYDRITKQYGHESIVIFSGTGREGGTFGPYGSMCFGTPNFCYTQSGYACYTPRLAAIAYIAGTTYPEWDYAGALPGRWDDPRYEQTEVLIVWGKAPLESNPDGFFGHAVVDAMRRGTRLIVIDPRVNWLAARADLFIRLRVGTDTALGMAMLDVIIKEDLYDHDFVEYWCYGFDQLAERCAEMPPERAAEICEIPVEQIYKAARMYATAKPAAIQWGLAADQKTNGMQQGQVTIALMAITGNLDRPGGQIIPGTDGGHNEAGFGDEGMDPMLRQKMIGLEEYPAYCNIIMSSHADLTLKALETGEPYPLKMGFYAGNNLMSCTSMEPKRWHDAIVNSLEFCIGFDTFMNPSIEASCDIFLPLKTAAEQYGTLFTHYAPCTVTAGFMQPAFEVGECKTDYELCYELGNILRPELWRDTFKFKNDLEFLEALRLGRREGGEYLKKVAQNVHCQMPIEYYKYENGKMRVDGSMGFATPTGRVELWSTAFHQFGEDPLPYYEEPEFGPVDPELMKEYPLLLTTGARTTAFFHSENRQIPFCRELCPDPIVDINPETAKKYGITDGQWVKITSPFGECVEKAHVSEIVDEKTIHAQHAWWFPEEDGNEPNLYGNFRSNINNLLPNFHFRKLGFGAPNKCLVCKIEPVLENYDTDMDLIWEKFGKLV